MNLEEQFYYYFALKSDDKPNKFNIFYLRGLFDKYGNIEKRTFFVKSPEVSIILENKYFLECLEELNKSLYEKCKIKNNFCLLQEHDAFDFLAFIYDKSDARCRNNDNYTIYLQWSGVDLPNVKVFKTCSDAILPYKERASDVGYDLTIIKKVKDIGTKTAMYDTGIKVSPMFGYYTKIVPRSSLVKSGYMLTNSTGIIDGSYKGNLMICLTKIDDTLPDLKLPFRCCQLIIDKSIHYIIDEVSDESLLGDSSRGEGGFGSTNK